MSHKRGAKTITGEDEFEVDIIDILGDNGLEIKNYSGVAGDVLQKSSVTNELEWAVVPPPGNNTITADMLQTNSVTTDKIMNLNVTTGKIGDLQVTDGKIANTTITGGKLATDIAISTSGILTLKNGAGDVVLKMNAEQAGISSAGFGNIIGGPLGQYGVLIDENPLSGTYQKAVIFGNTLEAIVPANGGTGWFPLQVKEYDGAAGNLFKVDIDGNTTCALKLSCNNLDVDSGAATISAAGAIGCAGITSTTINTQNNNITMGTGDLTCDTIGCGAITSLNINTQNNNIVMGTGNITCDEIECGDITTAEIDTQDNDINAGTGNITCDTITCPNTSSATFKINTNQGFITFQDKTDTALVGSSADKTNVSEMKFNSSTNTFQRIDKVKDINMETDGSVTSITGTTYSNMRTQITNCALLSETNWIIPSNVYHISGFVYRMPFHAGIFHPNDDNSYYNYCIEDDGAKTRGRGHIRTSGLEVSAVIFIPRGWRAVADFVDIRDSSGIVVSSSPPTYHTYKIQVWASSGPYDAIADAIALSYGNKNINTENTYYNDAQFEGVADMALLIDINLTSVTQFVGGGYIKLLPPEDGGH